MSLELDMNLDERLLLNQVMSAQFTQNHAYFANEVKELQCDGGSNEKKCDSYPGESLDREINKDMWVDIFRAASELPDSDLLQLTAILLGMDDKTLAAKHICCIFKQLAGCMETGRCYGM